MHVRWQGLGTRWFLRFNGRAGWKKEKGALKQEGERERTDDERMEREREREGSRAFTVITRRRGCVRARIASEMISRPIKPWEIQPFLDSSSTMRNTRRRPWYPVFRALITLSICQGSRSSNSLFFLLSTN